MSWDWRDIKARYAKPEENGEVPPERAPRPPRATQSYEIDENDPLHPPGNTNPYIEAGVHDQLEELANTIQPGRNDCLYRSAKALGRIESIDRAWLRSRLKEACEQNGLTRDDGMTATNRTIKSAFEDADEAGPREINGPMVTEVSRAAFGVDDLEDDDDEPEPAAQSAPTVTSSLSSSKTASASGDTTTKPPRTTRVQQARDAIFAAEANFWQRDSLQHIYDMSLMKMVPPWSTLAFCAARMLHQIPPGIQLPASLCSPASLNWFGAVASRSAGGKSSSAGIASDLVLGVSDGDIRNIGSGEGIAAQYRPPGKGAPKHERLLFICEEIDSLTAMNERSGSTTTATLNNAWMGDPLGHSYIKNIKTEPLQKHTYRMTLIVGVQPGRASSLLNDRYSGCLQRFMWFPAFDPRISKKLARPNDFVTSLVLPDASNWQQSRKLVLPQITVDEMVEESERRSHDESDPLDGHLLLSAAKFAFALALLDARIEVTEEDWRLAKIALDVTKATRNWVMLECKEAEAELANLKGAPLGLVQLAARDARTEASDERMRGCARWILAQLKKQSPRYRRDLQIAAHYPAESFNDAIGELKRAGMIELGEAIGAKGQKRPTVALP